MMLQAPRPQCRAPFPTPKAGSSAVDYSSTKGTLGRGNGLLQKAGHCGKFCSQQSLGPCSQGPSPFSDTPTCHSLCQVQGWAWPASQCEEQVP